DHDRRALLDHRRALRRLGRRDLLPRMGEPLTAPLPQLTSWRADWAGLKVGVLGLGMTGFSVADTLTELGAHVLVVAARATQEYRDLVAVIGAQLVLDDDARL